MILFSRVYLAASEDIFDCHNVGVVSVATGI